MSLIIILLQQKQTKLSFNHVGYAPAILLHLCSSTRESCLCQLLHPMLNNQKMHKSNTPEFNEKDPRFP